MADWLKAKDAQLRSQREKEVAQQMEAEREKALWLEERRARLSVTLHRIETRAKRRSTRLAKLAPGDRDGNDGDPARDEDSFSPAAGRLRPEGGGSGASPVKPSSSRRAAARPGGGARHTLSSSMDGHVPGFGDPSSAGGSAGDSTRSMQRDARRVRSRPPPSASRATSPRDGGHAGHYHGAHRRCCAAGAGGGHRAHLSSLYISCVPRPAVDTSPCTHSWVRHHFARRRPRVGWQWWSAPCGPGAAGAIASLA